MTPRFCRNHLLFGFTLAESARLMPVTASPGARMSTAQTGHIS